MTAVLVVLVVVLIAAVLLVVRQGHAQQALVLGRLERVDGRLDETLRDASARMQNVGQELQAVHDAAGHIQETARSLNRFVEILGTPSARGRLGETMLERLLAQVLPRDTYALQHRFLDGSAVDAVIRLGPVLVPVDAKFPLEAYARFREAIGTDQEQRQWREFVRVVMAHTDAVARYIRPDEKTFGFAMMYVPAEAVFYECFVRHEPAGPDELDLQRHALDRRVIAVSPNSFYAYLQSVALGLRGLRVEEQAQEILGQLDRVRGEFDSFRKGFRLVGVHLGRAKERYDELLGPAARLDARLGIISRLDGNGSEPEAELGWPEDEEEPAALADVDDYR